VARGLRVPEYKQTTRLVIAVSRVSTARPSGGAESEVLSELPRAKVVVVLGLSFDRAICTGRHEFAYARLAIRATQRRTSISLVNQVMTNDVSVGATCRQSVAVKAPTGHACLTVRTAHRPRVDSHLTEAALAVGAAQRRSFRVHVLGTT